MKVIYVAGPFRASDSWGIERNVRIAEEMALSIWATRVAVPICPHTMTRFYQDSLPDQVWLEGGIELLERCDAVYVLRDWESSEGTKLEIARAEELSKPIFYEWVDFVNWLQKT